MLRNHHRRAARGRVMVNFDFLGDNFWALIPIHNLLMNTIKHNIQKILIYFWKLSEILEFQYSGILRFHPTLMYENHLASFFRIFDGNKQSILEVNKKEDRFLQRFLLSTLPYNYNSCKKVPHIKIQKFSYYLQHCTSLNYTLPGTPHCLLIQRGV